MKFGGLESEASKKDISTGPQKSSNMGGKFKCSRTAILVELVLLPSIPQGFGAYEGFGNCIMLFAVILSVAVINMKLQLYTQVLKKAGNKQFTCESRRMCQGPTQGERIVTQACPV